MPRKTRKSAQLAATTAMSVPSPIAALDPTLPAPMTSRNLPSRASSRATSSRPSSRGRSTKPLEGSRPCTPINVDFGQGESEPLSMSAETSSVVTKMSGRKRKAPDTEGAEGSRSAPHPVWRTTEHDDEEDIDQLVSDSEGEVDLVVSHQSSAQATPFDASGSLANNLPLASTSDGSGIASSSSSHMDIPLTASTIPDSSSSITPTATSNPETSTPVSTIPVAVSTSTVQHELPIGGSSVSSLSLAKLLHPSNSNASSSSPPTASSSNWTTVMNTNTSPISHSTSFSIPLNRTTHRTVHLPPINPILDEDVDMENGPSSSRAEVSETTREDDGWGELSRSMWSNGPDEDYPWTVGSQPENSSEIGLEHSTNTSSSGGGIPMSQQEESMSQHRVGPSSSIGRPTFSTDTRSTGAEGATAPSHDTNPSAISTGASPSRKQKETSPAIPTSNTLLTTSEKGTSSTSTEPKHKRPSTPAPKPTPPTDPLSEYTCPICFFPPSNATLTPCGHICCGSCLFTAIRTTMQRAGVIGGENIARCPVCRAAIPGWDGRGGGVVGLKIRAVFSM